MRGRAQIADSWRRNIFAFGSLEFTGTIRLFVCLCEDLASLIDWRPGQLPPSGPHPRSPSLVCYSSICGVNLHVDMNVLLYDISEYQHILSKSVVRRVLKIAKSDC